VSDSRTTAALGGESFERRPDVPRRVRSGIRIKAAGGEASPTWVGQGWIALLEALVPSHERIEGLDYARRGQTVSLELGAGFAQGRVQGRAAQPYTTRWTMPVFDGAQWQRMIEAMAGEALYAAKLLAHELSPAQASLLESLGLGLLPQASEVALQCDCSRGGACKHAATVGYLLAERLDRDPLTAFELRGMPVQRLLDRLAAVRARRVRGVAAHAEPIMPQAARKGQQPLAACVESFWRPGSELTELQRMDPPQHAPHALLRRLGPSPLTGNFPMVGLLASVYDTVAAEAVRLRDRAERIEPSDD
jgi:uncharacterized Zn finger protein